MCIYCKKSDSVPIENYLINREVSVDDAGAATLQLSGIMYDDGGFYVDFAVESSTVLSQSIQFKYCPMCGRKF